MRVLLELNIDGDFPEGLSEEDIEDILDKVIETGCVNYYLNGHYILKEIIES